jgi:ribosome biogenesis protein UTP30
MPTATPSSSTQASQPLPLPSTFSTAQAKKAVDALLAHAAKVAKEREETELIAREEHVWLNVNTKHPTTRKRLMPVRM